jgi:hypothetical protein
MYLKELRFGLGEGFLLLVLAILFDGVLFVSFLRLFNIGNLRPLENGTFLLAQHELDHLLDAIDLPKVPPDLHLPGMASPTHEPGAMDSRRGVEEGRALGENPIAIFNSGPPKGKENERVAQQGDTTLRFLETLADIFPETVQRCYVDDIVSTEHLGGVAGGGVEAADELHGLGEFVVGTLLVVAVELVAEIGEDAMVVDIVLLVLLV